VLIVPLCLCTNRSPNPRLQRTPAALPPSPLSRKPLDDRPEGSVA
jgi:hypothetical protein